jgi:hypothetical protein
VSRSWFLAFSLLVFLKERKSVMLCCTVVGCVCKHVWLYFLMHACTLVCMCMHASFQLWTSWSVFKKFGKNVELLECVQISYFHIFNSH